MSLPVLVLISAGAEWRATVPLFPGVDVQTSPLGEWFEAQIGGREVVFFHGGWGKIAAAASAQYAVDRWKPGVVVNLGTCGGLAGRAQRGEVLLVERTLVYDIVEQMGDPDEAIAHYAVALDLSWLHGEPPIPARRGLLVSADRDLMLADLPSLIERYEATAADWESGAIAWVAARNGKRALILRGVSDLVGADGGEAYGNFGLFEASTREIMARLVGSLPGWLAMMPE